MTGAMMPCGVLPFMMDAAGRPSAMRGLFARLDDVASAILSRHDYPLAVAELSAEAMALAACLSTTMSFDGIFTLQASGSGPVKTLMADVTSEGAIRGFTHVDGDSDILDSPLGGPAPIMHLMGGGYLAFTVDQGEKGRYQGIVPIEDADLTGVSMRYFRDSEQIDTALLVAAEPDQNSGWRASALMLQRIPEEGGEGAVLPASKEEAEEWHTACTLMATCTRDELLDPALSQQDLLYRLFNQLSLSVMPLLEIRDECRCSPEKVERMLEDLPREEKLELAEKDNTIVISCEFCKKAHHYVVE